MPWFLKDAERLKRERSAVEALSRSAEWLAGIEWHLDKDGNLCLDAIVRAHAHEYELSVSFPSLYPDAPSVVRTRNMGSRLSSHQYGGANGTLCLEWGPDNWHRDLTAVQMLESAHRLLEIENPLGHEQPNLAAVAPSRHELTMGQKVRSQWARWYLSHGLKDTLSVQLPSATGVVKFSLCKRGENWTVLIHEVSLPDAQNWKDSGIPTALPGAEAQELDAGVWVKTDIDAKAFASLTQLTELQTLLGDDERIAPLINFEGKLAGLLIVDRIGEPQFFIVFPSGKLALCSNVESERILNVKRSPEFPDLAGRKIGIVGIGSAGSKIATSLARMGVRDFFLVDHDILLPENLHRHALDWMGVTQHKVDSMAIALRNLAAGVTVEVSRVHLTGQESNAIVSGALEKLAGCDLIVDATASPRVFNLVAAVARSSGCPMIWMEVFAGGLGGMVARSRPGLDPTPQDMRAVFLQYCTNFPFETATKTTKNYGVETDDGEVIAASDADVALIAHHAVRFAPDCFRSPESSKFPHSMYLVGLDKGWVFEAPFATIPISTEMHPASGWPINQEMQLDSEGVEFVLELIKNQHDAAASAPEDCVPTG